MSDLGDSAGRPNLRVLPGGGAATRREDEALLAGFLVGDDEAFGELVRRHELLVLRIARRWSASPDDARDLAQRTFLRAFEAARRTLRRSLGGRRPGFVFKAWLVRIAVNVGKNHRRDVARARLAPLEALDRGEPGATEPTAPRALEEAERARLMRRAVAELPRRQREVLTLRIDAELPFAEIAEALGTSENSAKVTFHHATRRLRELVGEDAP